MNPPPAFPDLPPKMSFYFITEVIVPRYLFLLSGYLLVFLGIHLITPSMDNGLPHDVDHVTLGLLGVLQRLMLSVLHLASNTFENFLYLLNTALRAVFYPMIFLKSPQIGGELPNTSISGLLQFATTLHDTQQNLHLLRSVLEEYAYSSNYHLSLLKSVFTRYSALTSPLLSFGSHDVDNDIRQLTVLPLRESLQTLLGEIRKLEQQDIVDYLCTVESKGREYILESKDSLRYFATRSSGATPILRAFFALGSILGWEWDLNRSGFLLSLIKKLLSLRWADEDRMPYHRRRRNQHLQSQKSLSSCLRSWIVKSIFVCFFVIMLPDPESYSSHFEHYRRTTASYWPGEDSSADTKLERDLANFAMPTIESLNRITNYSTDSLHQMQQISFTLNTFTESVARISDQINSRTRSIEVSPAKHLLKEAGYSNSQKHQLQRLENQQRKISKIMEFHIHGAWALDLMITTLQDLREGALECKKNTSRKWIEIQRLQISRHINDTTEYYDEAGLPKNFFFTPVPLVARSRHDNRIMSVRIRREISTHSALLFQLEQISRPLHPTPAQPFMPDWMFWSAAPPRISLGVSEQMAEMWHRLDYVIEAKRDGCKYSILGLRSAGEANLCTIKDLLGLRI